MRTQIECDVDGEALADDGDRGDRHVIEPYSAACCQKIAVSNSDLRGAFTA